MANQYKNKIIYGGETLIDLTQDDVLVSDVAAGKSFTYQVVSPQQVLAPTMLIHLMLLLQHLKFLAAKPRTRMALN